MADMKTCAQARAIVHANARAHEGDMIETGLLNLTDIEKRRSEANRQAATVCVPATAMEFVGGVKNDK